MADESGIQSPVLEISGDEDQNANWTDPQGRSPHDQANVEWAAARTEDVNATNALRKVLREAQSSAAGLDAEGYQRRLADLPSDERIALVGMGPNELVAHLEGLAEAEKESQKTARELEALTAEQRDANLIPHETPHLREMRNTTKAALDEVADLDRRIEEFRMLNAMRLDVTHEGWDSPHISSEQWQFAREGIMEPLDAEIAQLLAEKQTKLQEAGIHQDAYNHEANSRTTQHQQVPAQRDPAVDRIIARLTAPGGQQVPISEADIATTVQIERQRQAHSERVTEARQRITNYDQPFERAREASMRGVDIPLPTAPQIAYIHSFDNSADIAHHLVTHPADADALRRMSHREAEMAIKLIASSIGKRGTKSMAQPAAEAPKKSTTAPKPPSPVSRSASRVFDANDESGTADDWFKNRNEQLRRIGRR